MFIINTLEKSKDFFFARRLSQIINTNACLSCHLFLRSCVRVAII